MIIRIPNFILDKNNRINGVYCTNGHLFDTKPIAKMFESLIKEKLSTVKPSGPRTSILLGGASGVHPNYSSAYVRKRPKC